MRYKFVIQYDGYKFPAGWQSQPNTPDSVQNVLAKAAYELLGEEVSFYGSGRTDGGVHAWGQVAHIDIKKRHSLKSLHEGMNYFLGRSGCRIASVAPVDQDFHARFSAKSKTYQYIISHSRICNVFDQDRVWWIRDSTDLNLDLMQAEAKKLLGTHDFTSFRSAACQSSTPIRTIDEINFRIEASKIYIDFVGKSFLNKQIRIMVGTLVDIARGHMSDIESILLGKNRKAAGQTAPACGLYLMELRY